MGAVSDWFYPSLTRKIDSLSNVCSLTSIVGSPRYKKKLIGGEFCALRGWVTDRTTRWMYMLQAFFAFLSDAFRRCLKSGIQALLIFSVSFCGAVFGTAANSAVPAAALDVHPQEFIAARLSAPAAAGERTLRVEDYERLDPRALLLLKTVDGEIQEVACIKSIRDQQVKLTAELRHAFPEGSMIIQTSLIRDRSPVGDLAQRARQGRSELTLRDASGIDALQRVVVQSPDRRVREAHCVRSVAGTRVLLADALRNGYPPDSVLIQGDLVQGELTRDRPCCCEGDGKCCTHRLLGAIEPSPPPLPPPPSPPPLTLACRGLASRVGQGESTTVDAVVTGAEPENVTFSWTIDGNPAAVTGSSLELSPVDLEPGEQVIRATATTDGAQPAANTLWWWTLGLIAIRFAR